MTKTLEVEIKRTDGPRLLIQIFVRETYSNERSARKTLLLFRFLAEQGRTGTGYIWKIDFKKVNAQGFVSDDSVLDSEDRNMIYEKLRDNFLEKESVSKDLSTHKYSSTHLMALLSLTMAICEAAISVPYKSTTSVKLFRLVE